MFKVGDRFIIMNANGLISPLWMGKCGIICASNHLDFVHAIIPNHGFPDRQPDYIWSWFKKDALKYFKLLKDNPTQKCRLCDISLCHLDDKEFVGLCKSCEVMELLEK
jgi:hypothetical protein